MGFSYKEFCNIDRNESDMILDWRNHESVRKWMFNSNIISLKEHQEFLERLKTDLSKRYWLVFNSNNPIGVTSLIRIHNNHAEWGYYLEPSLHETTLSIELYYYTLGFFFDNLGFRLLYGYELPANKGASSLNTLFGFSKEEKEIDIQGRMTIVNYRELDINKWVVHKNSPAIIRFLDFINNRE